MLWPTGTSSPSWGPCRLTPHPGHKVPMASAHPRQTPRPAIDPSAGPRGRCSLQGPEPTWHHAAEGQRPLANEVPPDGVVVPDEEAHEGQLRHVHHEHQRLLPHGVEAWGPAQGVSPRARLRPGGPPGPRPVLASPPPCWQPGHGEQCLGAGGCPWGAWPRQRAGAWGVALAPFPARTGCSASVAAATWPWARGHGGPLAASPLSSTTRVCSLPQSTGSPMTSTSTNGSMICGQGRWHRARRALGLPRPCPGGPPTSPRSPSIESRGLGSCCPLMIRSTSCFLSCPGRGSSELGLKTPGGQEARLSGAGRAPPSAGHTAHPPPPLSGRGPAQEEEGGGDAAWGPGCRRL